MRSVFIGSALAALLLAPVHATTLQQLSLDDMIRKSSEIVRGVVHGTGSGFRGSTLYTNYRVQISEQWKGSSGAGVDFAVPGGVSNGIRQTYAGAPTLAEGQEFIFFLWTGRSGMRQLIGLSQGLFTLAPGIDGQLLAVRSPSTEQMLGPDGKPLTDSGFSMRVTALHSRVASILTPVSK